MSWLCDTTELVPGGWLSSLYPGHGVLGANVPSSGTHGPSALYPCLTLPADDGVEVRGLITREPVSGAFSLAEDGSFTYSGASDYFDFRLFADGVAETDDIGYGPGIVRVTLTVGSSGAGQFGVGAVLGAARASGALMAANSGFGAGAALGAVRASGGLLGDTSAPSYAAQPRTSASWSYRQTATLWRLAARAAWDGSVTHDAPVLFLCDYVADDRRVITARGDEFTTRLLIYTSLPGVKQGDMVLIGTSNLLDPHAAGADKVLDVRTWADTFTVEGSPDFRIAT